MKKVFLEISQNSQENTCASDSFLIKLREIIPIEGNNIEACHRISKKNERIIVKFSRRKDCQNVLNAKKELRKLDMKEIGFPEGNPIFVNQSLCTYYRVLWSKAKRLHSLKRISSFYVSGGTVKIKISKNSLPTLITHVNDFKEHFSNVSLAPPSESICINL